MKSSMNCTAAQPWYREPWTWFLMAGPALVVIAGIVTTWLAWTSNDGLVSDDYYKEGLAINRSLERDARALALDVSATVRFAPGHDKVRASLSGTDAELPSLRLQFAHPTLAGRDQTLTLVRVAPGLYEGRSERPLRQPMLLQLESAEGGWRLSAPWREGEESVVLKPRHEGGRA